MSKYIYFFNFGISFRDFYFYKTAASPDGLWWVRFQKKNDKMHRSLRSIGLLCCLWYYPNHIQYTGSTRTGGPK
jgi:hypothetical protein